jgi:hypothetical protein
MKSLTWTGRSSMPELSDSYLNQVTAMLPQETPSRPSLRLYPRPWFLGTKVSRSLPRDRHRSLLRFFWKDSFGSIFTLRAEDRASR